MTPTNKTIAAILTVCISATAIAQAAEITPDSHEKARSALLAQDYKSVVSIYGDNDEANLQGNGHYRMAIALERLDLPIRALVHLNKALTADPAAKFASSTEKIDQLRSRILAACEKQGALGCVEARAVELAAPPEPSPQIVVATPTTPPPTPVADLQPIPTPVAMEAQQISDLNSVLSGYKTIITILSAVLGALFVALLYSTIKIRKLKKQEKTRPLQISVTADRSAEVSFIPKKTALEELLTSLEAQMNITPSDTILYEKMQALLPQAQREYGRIQFAKTRDPAHLTKADRDQLEAAQKFEKTQMSMSNATSQDIVALFQSGSFASWVGKQ